MADKSDSDPPIPRAGESDPPLMPRAGESDLPGREDRAVTVDKKARKTFGSSV